ncbi:hypothetical protein [Paracoccus sp. PAR01]|uniref:hypothetical protein n=1 Tax=Paracoccus sp. PAR01 TaxID=2769282 RepID=UPI001782C7A6|nr:hypothetical protein [Paracoccus sp. PAR01]
MVADCDSIWWSRLHNQLSTQVEPIDISGCHFPLVGCGADNEHRALADATIAWHADRASAIMARHLHRAADTLLASPAPFVERSALRIRVISVYTYGRIYHQITTYGVE